MSKTSNRRAGFGVVGVVVVILVIAVIAGAGFVVLGRNGKKSTDTSARVPTPPVSVKENVPASPAEPAKAYPETLHYTNDKYGISFYYPQEWRVNEVTTTAPSGPAPIEFTVGLKGAKEEKYVAVFEVYSKNYKDIADYFVSADAGNNVAHQQRAEGSTNGKQSTSLITGTTFPNSQDRVEQYYYNAGTKTYGLRSINEELNVQRDSAYWDKFKVVHDSLELR
jgi:hypothetical protein